MWEHEGRINPREGASWALTICCFSLSSQGLGHYELPCSPALESADLSGRERKQRQASSELVVSWAMFGSVCRNFTFIL